MKKVTLRALQKSIKHWENNLNAEMPSLVYTDGDFCPLCDRFNKSELDEDRCTHRGELCPVAINAKSKGCSNTPWYLAAYAGHQWNFASDSPYAKQEWHKAAKAELAFLKSLLPKEK